MKTLITNLFLVLIFAVSIWGCGNNNPVTPTGGNPVISHDSLIFSQDSLSMWTRALGEHVMYAPYYGSISNDTTLDSIKITFNWSSNITNNTGSIYLALITYWYELNDIPNWQSNSNVVAYVGKHPNFTNTRFYEQLTITNNFQGGSYISVKNLKIYKVN